MWAVGNHIFPMAWKLMRLLCFVDLQFKSGRMQCRHNDVAERGGLKGGLHLSLILAFTLAVST